MVRARFRLIVTILPKYAYKEPAAILQAPVPEHIVEAGLPTEALLAQVAVSKAPTACRFTGKRRSTPETVSNSGGR